MTATPTRKPVRYRKETNADHCVYVDGKRNRFGNNRHAKAFFKAEKERVRKENKQ